jgi:hypothetical protein
MHTFRGRRTGTHAHAADTHAHTRNRTHTRTRNTRAHTQIEAVEGDSDQPGRAGPGQARPGDRGRHPPQQAVAHRRWQPAALLLVGGGVAGRGEALRAETGAGGHAVLPR